MDDALGGGNGGGVGVVVEVKIVNSSLGLRSVGGLQTETEKRGGEEQ